MIGPVRPIGRGFRRHVPFLPVEGEREAAINSVCSGVGFLLHRRRGLLRWLMPGT